MFWNKQPRKPFGFPGMEDIGLTMPGEMAPGTPSPVMDLLGGLAAAFKRPGQLPIGVTMDGPTVEQARPLPLGVHTTRATDISSKPDWFGRWNIEPAQDARYLPDFPESGDLSTGADLKRGWHQSYKGFARDLINQHFPEFGKIMPQPQADEAYDDYIMTAQNLAEGQQQNAADRFLGKAPKSESFFGFLPGKTQPKQDIPKPQEWDQNKLKNEGEEPAVKPPALETQDFLPLDEMLQEIEERQARGEVFDENGDWIEMQVPNVKKSTSQNIYGQKESENVLIDYFDKQIHKPMVSPKLSSYEQATIDWLKDRENMNATSKDLAPHQPSEASGVTIGYGYDFKERTPEQVQKDLEKAGFPQDQIDLYKQAAGKSTFSADKYMRENADKFKPITKEQADILLRQDPRLDEAFRRVDKIATKVPLTVNQKNALVSLGYNVPVALGEKSAVIKNLRKGDQASAAKAFELYNQSGGKVLRGLVDRRALERDLFLKIVNPK